jgi:AcrR family transcriptional regulator
MVENSVREQRKSQTRDALCQAAVEIVGTEGLDALTADRIAEVAGVSRRTLFNYFARVEDIVTATIEDVSEETIRAVVERHADEPLRDAVCGVLETLVDSPAFDQVRLLERAARRSSATRRFLLEFGDRQTHAFAEGLSRRIGPDADPVYVSSLAAATSAILAAATRLAVDSTDDEAEAAACHPAYIRRAFVLLFAGFDESSATTTSVKEV